MWGLSELELPTLDAQVETLAAKVLVGAAIAYIGLMVLIPFANVFWQVGSCSLPWALFSGCCTACGALHWSCGLDVPCSCAWLEKEQSHGGCGPGTDVFDAACSALLPPCMATFPAGLPQGL